MIITLKKLEISLNNYYICMKFDIKFYSKYNNYIDEPQIIFLNYKFNKLKYLLNYQKDILNKLSRNTFDNYYNNINLLNEYYNDIKNDRKLYIRNDYFYLQQEERIEELIYFYTKELQELSKKFKKKYYRQYIIIFILIVSFSQKF